MKEDGKRGGRADSSRVAGCVARRRLETVWSSLDVRTPTLRLREQDESWEHSGMDLVLADLDTNVMTVVQESGDGTLTMLLGGLAFYLTRSERESN